MHCLLLEVSISHNGKLRYSHEHIQIFVANVRFHEAVQYHCYGPRQTASLVHQSNVSVG
jgi:hypothetical protein